MEGIREAMSEREHLEHFNRTMDAAIRIIVGAVDDIYPHTSADGRTGFAGAVIARLASHTPPIMLKMDDDDPSHAA